MRREQYGHQVGGYRRGTVNSVEPPRARSLAGSRRHRPRTPHGPSARSCARRARAADRAVARRPAHRAAHRACPGDAAADQRRVVRAAAGRGRRRPATPRRRHRRPRPSRAGPVHRRRASQPLAWLHLLERLARHRRPAPRQRRRRSGASGAREWPVVAAVDATRLPAVLAPRRRRHRRRPPGHAVQPDAGRRRRPTARVIGYAVFGRSGERGFVQRIAVDPACPGPGRRHGARCSTACAGSPAAGAGQRPGQHPDRQRAGAARSTCALGFRLLDERLAVLGRPLDDRREARSAPSLAAARSWRPASPRPVGRRAADGRRGRRRRRSRWSPRTSSSAPGGTASFTFTVGGTVPDDTEVVVEAYTKLDHRPGRPRASCWPASCATATSASWRPRSTCSPPTPSAAAPSPCRP